jgi:hypothetical protein
VLLSSGGALRRFTLYDERDRSDGQGQVDADTVTWMEPLRDAVEAVAAEERFSGAVRVDLTSCRDLSQTGEDAQRKRTTGLEPATSSLGSWRSTR